MSDIGENYQSGMNYNPRGMTPHEFYSSTQTRNDMAMKLLRYTLQIQTPASVEPLPLWVTTMEANFPDTSRLVADIQVINMISRIYYYVEAIAQAQARCICIVPTGAQLVHDYRPQEPRNYVNLPTYENPIPAPVTQWPQPQTRTAHTLTGPIVTYPPTTISPSPIILEMPNEEMNPPTTQHITPPPDTTELSIVSVETVNDMPTTKPILTHLLTQQNTSPPRQTMDQLNLMTSYNPIHTVPANLEFGYTPNSTPKTGEKQKHISEPNSPKTDKKRHCHRSECKEIRKRQKKDQAAAKTTAACLTTAQESMKKQTERLYYYSTMLRSVTDELKVWKDKHVANSSAIAQQILWQKSEKARKAEQKIMAILNKETAQSGYPSTERTREFRHPQPAFKPSKTTPKPITKPKIIMKKMKCQETEFICLDHRASCYK